MSEPIISVSGLRGIVGESLDPILAIRFVNAFAGGVPAGPIVVTRDGRETGTMLANAVCSGLSAIGRDVLYGDVAATPTTGILVRSHQAAGGIQISASHNPPPYNGIKLFGSSGRVISADEGNQVIANYRKNDSHWVGHANIGSIEKIEDTISEHLKLVLDTVDVDLIRQKKFKVVLDSNHGAGSILGRRLLTELGTEFELMGDQPNGHFEHPPEPTAENLQSVAAQAQQFGADVVFCQDPDADRLAIIDELGNYIGEEYTLAITLRNRLQQTAGPVVINCATSRMSEDIAAEFNCEIHRSAVGEANVTGAMIERDAVYGGEGNGGPIDPRVGLVRDSFVGIAQTLEALAKSSQLAKSNQTVSELVANLPRYAIVKTKAQVDPERLRALTDEIGNKYPDAGHSQLDGLRLYWPDRWVLIRASNTEPIVRIIAEAESDKVAQSMCDEILNIL